MMSQAGAEGQLDTVLDIRKRWQTIEALFHQALARSAGEREEFLKKACKDDSGLHHEITSLLTAYRDVEAFRESAASELARELTSDEEPAPGVGESAAHTEHIGQQIGQQIGPYRLLKTLGSGAVGTVYLAEQSDPLPRRVALKLMRWGAPHGETLRRFELERESMVRLSHSAIAQVFDAGATERGRLYVVLEYIPGESIIEYCRARKLNLRKRLELLVAVCDGVRHAHEKGVIHRDLKPSNILVAESSGGPQPKIIDFGVAKALEPWSKVAAATTGSRQPTKSPSYESPETRWTGGRATDTRSNVYSLGVILWELLAGVRPFDSLPIPAGDPKTQRKAMEAPRPSQRFLRLPTEERQRIARERSLEDSRLGRRLEGELDWIAQRATAVEPSQRYSTAADLANDLQNWLAGRFVEAASARGFYRVRKTFQRRAVAVSVALLSLLCVIGLSIHWQGLSGRGEASGISAAAQGAVGDLEALEAVEAALEIQRRIRNRQEVSRYDRIFLASVAVLAAELHLRSGDTDGLHQAARQAASVLREIDATEMQEPLLRDEYVAINDRLEALEQRLGDANSGSGSP